VADAFDFVAEFSTVEENVGESVRLDMCLCGGNRCWVDSLNAGAGHANERAVTQIHALRELSVRRRRKNRDETELELVERI
jgi:hypothetical protein